MTNKNQSMILIFLVLPFDFTDLIECLDMFDTVDAFLVTVACLLGILDTAEGFLEIDEIVETFLSPCTGQEP